MRSQMIFNTAPMATTAIVNNGQCLCYSGTSCPTGGGIDIRIVNTGTACPSGQVYCCVSPGNDASCGIRKIPSSPHPPGQAAYGAYPWQVAILTDGNVYLGGGVLVSSMYVLTAAHKVAGYVCWVTGWGKNAFNGMYQTILREVDVPVMSQADCQTALRKTRLGNSFILDSSSMCAGGEVGKDACTGDGGSPLVCSINNGPYQVVGLVTWGIGCADAGVPGVYTNVYYFLSWIKQQMT
ncbi:peroxisomal membrane protein pex16 [Lasius niger]|uniref:Peroxisomal membrane protein pex16 n=1 Tax=Lasius niger TaxID=67767 RepID=A0A0J7K806_LASNI|nr:peroxisomal membrane protein pex16 [Lasius niger]